jgi:hypothetical protein
LPESRRSLSEWPLKGLRLSGPPLPSARVRVADAAARCSVGVWRTGRGRTPRRAPFMAAKAMAGSSTGSFSARPRETRPQPGEPPSSDPGDSRVRSASTRRFMAGRAVAEGNGHLSERPPSPGRCGGSRSRGPAARSAQSARGGVAAGRETTQPHVRSPCTPEAARAAVLSARA